MLKRKTCKPTYVWRLMAISVGMLQTSAFRLHPNIIIHRSAASIFTRHRLFTAHKLPFTSNGCSLRLFRRIGTRLFDRNFSQHYTPTIHQSMKLDDQEIAAVTSESLDGNTFTLFDILDYLDEVESHLRRPSVPASECHYSYQSDNDDTFYKYVGATLSKPILRTLIYGGMLSDDDEGEGNRIDWDSDALRTKQRTEKVKFDERIRGERVLLQFERMSSFVLNQLKPALLRMDQDTRDIFVPELLGNIKQIEEMKESVEKGDKIESKSLIVFPRLASGRYYKGQLDKMILDLFPQLYESYLMVSQQITDREVFERLIHLELTIDHVSKTKTDEEFHSRRVKAAFECLNMFYPASGEVSYNMSERGKKEGSAESSHLSGKDTEDACSNYIENMIGPSPDNIVLKNVFINARRSSDERYKPPRNRRNKSTVIWTDEGGSDRYRVCSEFDILLLKQSAQDVHHIKSIWEAKRTISPSTLYDVLSKKLGAVELLLDDTSAELIYEDGGATRALPFSDSAIQQKDSSFTFGIYGMELLHPTNAADSIRSVAGANVVSSNLKEVILAIERCVENNNSLLLVEVDTQRTLNIVDKLRTLIKAKLASEKQIQILLYIERGVEFTLKR